MEDEKMRVKELAFAKEQLEKPTTVRRKRKRDLFRWYLVVPCLAYIIYFAVMPMGFLGWVSFLRYEIIIPDFPVQFVGLKNFVTVLRSREFWSSCRVTMWLSVAGPLIQLAVGLGLALLLHQIGKGRGIMTTILLIPLMCASAAVAFNWKTMYAVSGPLNFFLSLVGVPKIHWTGSVTWALPAIMMIHVWKQAPFMMILLLAGLASLPQQVYEAASLASKSSWKTFIHITLPLLRPFIFLALILRFIDAFKWLSIIWIVTEGGPGSATENLALLTFTAGLRGFNIGYAAAMSIIQLFIILTVCYVLLRPRAAVSG